MAAQYTFGENTRVSVQVKDCYDSSFNPRKGYVVGEVMAGSSKVVLQLDPRAAVALGEQLLRHGRKVRRAAAKKARATPCA